MIFADYITTMPLTDLIGILGFCVYVTNYTLLTLHKLDSRGVLYFVLNIAAASCVLIGLAGSFNLAAALIQGFWIVASLAAIILRFRQDRRAPAGGAAAQT
ncbi:CBU_0592 family membrane protein [Flavimaricola marinus]|uniref:CBU-0592-like domain-containing protein n=1 Tax=Flavimaricola marinus TaxID=1819565 RepID=A0A238LGW2_9RHOB|nr:hypothetical protein [Flavimaricola marinus]SMY08645.1 hypothetical protein LOM8899_02800 [Flavimaricola marinus]